MCVHLIREICSKKAGPELSNNLQMFVEHQLWKKPYIVFYIRTQISTLSPNLLPPHP